MFGIDSPELLVIAVVALVVIGPKELPGMLRSWGKWMAQMRGMASEFRGHVDEMVRQADLDELIDFSIQISKIVPLALGIAPFVAKRNTPLDGEAFAGIDVVDKRLARLRKGMMGRVDLRSTSARWAWVEYVLAQGGEAEGRAVLDAVHAGGKWRDYKNAFELD